MASDSLDAWIKAQKANNAAPKGSYVAFFEISAPIKRLQIGKLGAYSFPIGTYLYAGNAFGSGGLPARLARHFRSDKKRHWHIDYLLPASQPLGAFILENAERLECVWAAWLAEQCQSFPARFGSSDCHCPTHLFRVTDPIAGIKKRFFAQYGGIFLSKTA